MHFFKNIDLLNGTYVSMHFVEMCLYIVDYSCCLCIILFLCILFIDINLLLAKYMEVYVLKWI